MMPDKHDLYEFSHAAIASTPAATRTAMSSTHSVDVTPLDSRFAGVPFWALNGKLTPENLKREIREFKQEGMGGFFLHSRSGLSTAYLSEEWFDCIGAAVEEARTLSMNAWLYDEDRYPSGTGGGFVTTDRRWRGKGIFLEETTAAEAVAKRLPVKTVAVFAAMIDGDHASNVRRLDIGSEHSLRPGETRLAFYTDCLKCNDWYNGGSYLDTINPEAVAQFIAVTHEEYRKRFKDDFGTVIPGIFTDEPRYGYLYKLPQWENDPRYAIPWTEGLFENFMHEFGYDIVEHLPELFFEVEERDCVPCRVHYIKLLTDCFVNAYVKQIGTWCGDNHLQLTGHVNAEDSLSYQTLCVGSAMRSYEFMQMPGMDLLTEHHRAYQTAKQVVSVAHQLGKARRLSECYGCTGWNFSLLGFKALGDWQYALGINFRCLHLVPYTMCGEAKRDYPCPIGTHSNTPEDFHRLEDYFTRLGKMLSEGQEARSILVISAIESAWSMIHRNWRSENATVEYDMEFNGLSHELLAHQLDFDYADEDILSRYGKVIIRDRRAILQVGQANYQTVVIPHLVTIRRSTLEMLRTFQQQGGTVFTWGNAPAYLDGWRCATMDFPFKIVENMTNLLAGLEPFREVNVETTSHQPCPALLCHLRHNSNSDVLFLCNTGHPVNDSNDTGADYTEPEVMKRMTEYPSVIVTVKSLHAGKVVEFDSQCGRYNHVDAERIPGGWRIRTSFGRLESRLFEIRQKALPDKLAYPEDSPLQTMVEKSINPTYWNIQLSEPNVMVLDHFSWGSSKAEFVLSLDDRVRCQLKMPKRRFLLKNVWCRDSSQSNSAVIELETTILCDELPSGELFLVLERPELYAFELNGVPIALQPVGYWHEQAWEKCRIPASVFQKGENILRLQTKYDNKHPGLESMFLLGNFGVEITNEVARMIAPIRKLTLGDCGKHGLPFYAGNIIYETNVDLGRNRIGIIQIDDFMGTPLRIKINGHKVADFFYAPCRTSHIALPARFHLSLELAGNLRNSCGPFYQEETSPIWCGPEQFETVKTEKRKLVAFGLNAPVRILFSEKS